MKSRKMGSEERMGMFYSEISTMMYAMGDCRRPMDECVAMVETAVDEQMGTLIADTVDIASSRLGYDATEFDLVDILFRIRKNRPLMKRLINFTKAKDAASAFKHVAQGDRNEESAIVSTESKRIRNLRSCLETFDVTRELTSILEDSSMDEIKRARLTRSNARAGSVDMEEYTRILEASQVSFSGKNGNGKLRRWLFGAGARNEGVNLTNSAMDTVAFLAKEVVALLIDTALIVKNQTESVPMVRVKDELIKDRKSGAHTGGVSQGVSYLLVQKIRKRSAASASIGIDVIHSRSIQPSHLEEALRRLRSKRLLPFIGKPCGNNWFCP